ncbi:Hypothetical predicted protein [Marmota monax]|uniref:Uncharacterized protein n=1 Tax=Marmota monax TaxID=9995 RepID=A0A5E4BSS0_MARMO|nr:Hypothetical predicted protein [Marmota monax]
MHLRRPVVAPKTLVESHEANIMASRKWKVTMFMLATSLGLSANFAGTQVGLGKRKYLYALEEGIVHYTKEVYVPNPNNLEAVDLVTRLPKGAVLYKTFVHVVPAKPEGTFKLVAML